MCVFEARLGANVCLSLSDFTRLPTERGIVKALRDRVCVSVCAHKDVHVCVSDCVSV